MTVSYNKLWKRLIDLNMSKTQLRERSIGMPGRRCNRIS